MTVIDFERWRSRRSKRRTGGQIAALSYIREEIQDAGFQFAAQLIGLAAASMASEMRKPRHASNDSK